ncbi:MAG TPA: Crp/Fnr family transcriptional regulator [Flavobacteriales bacterium]|jgi:CRP-like cAMP-binding protein|nr:Crp/Fnr family transcriptional regulator [Flavobacteriales bacterium]
MHPRDLIALLPNRQVEKGEVLLHQGDVASHAYIVVHGCLRSFVTDAQGKEHILQFSPEGWVAADLKSLVRQVPAVHSIDALEPTQVALMNDASTAELENADVAWLRAHIHGLRNRVIVLTDRIAHLLASDARTRYLDFVQTYPSLVQRLPQKLIAAYLGITPESLSRVRRQLVEQEKAAAQKGSR